MTNVIEPALRLLTEAGTPMSAPDLCRAHRAEGGKGSEDGFRNDMKRLLLKGAVTVFEPGAGSRPTRYALPSWNVIREEVAIPEHGHVGSYEGILNEIEAEKVWTLAGVLRAANAAWGIDAGLDADVREARALMAEARRQVRERSPLGSHHMEGEPAVAVAAVGDVTALDAPQP